MYSKLNIKANNHTVILQHQNNIEIYQIKNAPFICYIVNIKILK